ncbi:hypothetical protein GOAMR_46_00220 [Gordonia amarae NBRC 15530]|uniref:Uncharacterized protein n=2 Tax=Gordonia amarae TaxID=36821 RepID=G7GQQ1_9ACTN|nr:hypothetical protein GOAMR_46_00220 [Gordonia amarae NBRC 15530]
MFRKLMVALMALALAAGLTGLVAGEASAYPNRGWPEGPGHSWNQPSNRVDITVVSKQGFNRWGNGHNGWNQNRWGNGRQAPRVYLVVSSTGSYAGSATLIGNYRQGSSTVYRYTARNLPWNTTLTAKAEGRGVYSAAAVYFSRPGYPGYPGNTVTQSATLYQY